MSKTKLIIGAVFVLLLMLIGLSGYLFETNDSGYFQVKQALWTGDLSVRFESGTYPQLFADIYTYKNVATVGIGAHNGEGSADVDAVPVIFNDGSVANISGLIRVKLPTTREGAINLKTEFAEGYDHFISSGVVPIVNNAIKLSANLRSAQDAYTTLALFQQAVEDQLKNGIYVTKSDVVKIERTTGDIEEQRVTAIVYDKNGKPVRNPNRLQELQCEVTECVIDVPEFDEKVKKMISARKDEAMKTELAKQSAIRAKQDAITAEEQGKADVAKAKYVKEVELVRATTDARKEFEVAQLQAKQAEQEKKKKILIAEGIKEELRIADGLSQREKYVIDAAVRRDSSVAASLSQLKLPTVVVSGGGGNGNGQSNMENVLMLQMISNMIDKTDFSKLNKK